MATRDGTLFTFNPATGAFRRQFGVSTPSSAGTAVPLANIVDITSAAGIEWDVVIVGAGFAGLVAARELCWRLKSNVSLMPSY